jgi:glycosyltransferase involved in cell wall biosynthesis
VDYLSHFAMTFPVFCRFALEDEQVRILSEEYDLPPIEEEEVAELPVEVARGPLLAPVKVRVPIAPHIEHRRPETSCPGILFLADTPLESEELCRQQRRRHFSGVKSLLDELKRHAVASEMPITIGQPSHEPLPGSYEIVRAGNLTLVKLRPSVELYFGDCPTDLPIELTIDLGLALTQAEILERSKVRMLLQKRYRKVQPFSPSHRIMRDLIESGAIGPFQATVSIDCGPYAKLAFAEGRGNLDVPTFGIYTTNLADSTLRRMETLYKKIARDITRQPLEEPLSRRAEEVLSHILLPVARFVSGMQTEFLNAVDLLFAPPGNVDDLRKKGITSAVKELGRGLNKDFFKPGEKGPSERIRLVCAGRLFAENKPGDIVAMIERLAADVRGRVFLDVVGDGDERPGLEARLKWLMGSNVRFHGALPQKQVGEIMGRADVSIVAGDYHTYGQVYREGLACGAIQVAKDCFAARGVVADYRTGPVSATGILYQDPAEAARAIAEFLTREELREKLQSNCLERAKGFPLWNEVFERQLFTPIEEVVTRYRKKNTLSGIIRQRVRRGR